MTEVHWRPEPGRLAKVRQIICEVPELLLDILAFDYGDISQLFNRPEDAIEVRYYWSRKDRGAAWTHLMRHPPHIEVNGRKFRPFIERKKHPYRKKHGADYWAWIVNKWEELPHEPATEDDEDDEEVGGNCSMCGDPFDRFDEDTDMVSGGVCFGCFYSAPHR